MDEIIIDVEPWAPPGCGWTKAAAERYGVLVGRGERSGEERVVFEYRDAADELTVAIPGQDPEAARSVLIGRGLFGGSGKKLIVGFGPASTLALAQAQDLRWPVVGTLTTVPREAAAALRAHLTFAEGYESVVLVQGQDEASRRCAEACAAVLQPGKAYVATVPLRDPAEAAAAGQVEAIKRAVWEARPWAPGGLVNAADLVAQVLEPTRRGLPLPWRGLDEMLQGQHPGTIITWTSGSGMGKSAFVAEVAYSALMSGYRVGYIALEESTKRTAQRFVGRHLGIPIHLPGRTAPREALRAAAEATLGTQRLWLYDHFGSLAEKELVAKIRYLAKGLGCKILVLDHISIVVSGMDTDGDERRTIDRLMTILRSVAQETGIILHVVCHLSRPGVGAKSHEEGGRVTLGQLRGSGAIAQLSDAVVGLERDQQADDPLERRRTRVRVLKNRLSGETGLACLVVYDPDTGLLKEDDGKLPEEDERPAVVPGLPRLAERSGLIRPDPDNGWINVAKVAKVRKE